MKDKTLRILVVIAFFIVVLILLSKLSEVVIWLVAGMLAFLVYRNWTKIKKLWK
ncbi:MAG: hypothetical protein AABX33_07295 [Nanoarchaeota archaeon]